MEHPAVSPDPQRAWYFRPWGRFFVVLLAVTLFIVGLFGYLVFQAYRIGQSTPADVQALSDPSRITQGAQQTSVANSVDRAIVETADDPALGPADAPVTIVEFGDFECPFCRESFFVMKDLLEEYRGQLRIIYRDFPNSSLHPNAFSAALAAQCAHAQGKFWELHDLLFLQQEQLTTEALFGYAEKVHVDLALFRPCFDGQLYSSEITSDYEAGLELGVGGTPTWFVNGRRIEGALQLETFKKVIDLGLEGKL